MRVIDAKSYSGIFAALPTAFSGTLREREREREGHENRSQQQSLRSQQHKNMDTKLPLAKFLEVHQEQFLTQLRIATVTRIYETIRQKQLALVVLLAEIPCW